ncbi:MAG: Spore cortex-lytic enzyme, N-acetylglucosaminidase SleL [Candidatus Carbobacillus altaicus]|uniref:Spore cortex-lytic enzyme, N-acetylglucosaminidase SleL n=1 Tax=Candidatus Carbonibacillus altaicus TaxID=2163959 RepID=A0A2R6XXY0_9BACL|nr:MAG: Spore cortex-lytic enzyme, N-acetylglucosaminidase SleL [Candidatus Carbobacillus altaicus]
MPIYVIKKGDTLWNIASEHNTTVQDIIRLNQLPNPERLVVGQAIVLPEPKKIHIVQPGESLWLIARRYGLSIQSLIAENNIQNPNRLQVGARLTIPSAPTVHIVARGETLYSIAQTYHTTVQSLVQANRLPDPSRIYPGQRLLIVRPLIEINGYLTDTGPDGQKIIEDVGSMLTYVSLFSYHILPDGSWIPLQDEIITRTARVNKVVPLLTLTNFSGRMFSSDLAEQFLTNTAAQVKLLRAIIPMMREKGYGGLNIDFEYVYPRNRTHYNDFLKRAREALAPYGYSLSTALAPKITAEQSGLLYEAHDYPVHGELSDFVVLMTYEWGWTGGPPWAISPVTEVKKVLDYAVSVIPPHKILMGMPTYGRDWKLPFVKGQSQAETITVNEAIERAARKGASIAYHPEYEAPTFRYVDEEGQTHEVWFEDARSVQAKVDLIHEYQLRGISYWVLNAPFPQNWAVLKENVTVKKLL